MEVTVRPFTADDIEAMRLIWNTVVQEGIAFPQENTTAEAAAFFNGQTTCGVALAGDEIIGLYILHPNNVGRCGHIANASYAVKSGQRGKHVGRKLVRDSIQAAVRHSFRILQFNAVVATNHSAMHLYEDLGFIRLGTIKDGFRLAGGEYVDIHPYYLPLV